MDIREIVAKRNDERHARYVETLKDDSWFNGLSEECRAQHLEKDRRDGFNRYLILAEIIAEKGDRLCGSVRDGRFRTCNPVSRSIFQDVAGIALPNGNRKTRDTITAWLGPVWTDHSTRREAEWKALEERKQREKEEAARKEIGDTEIAIRNGAEISARQLIDVCAAHGIEIPIRTRGAMLKSTGEIRGNAMTVSLRRGKRPRFQHHPTLYYKAVEAVLNGEDPIRFLPSKKAA